MTDVGTTPRGSMSQTRRLRIFEAGHGRCILCDQKIRAGDTWTVEHIRALALGGADDDANCGPAHEQCRRIKDKTDLKSVAKSKRMKIAHYGGALSRNPMVGSRASGWKKTFRYGWVRR